MQFIRKFMSVQIWNVPVLHFYLIDFSSRNWLELVGFFNFFGSNSSANFECLQTCWSSWWRLFTPLSVSPVSGSGEGCLAHLLSLKWTPSSAFWNKNVEDIPFFTSTRMCGSAFSFQEQRCKFSSVISHNMCTPKQWLKALKFSAPWSDQQPREP